MSLVLFFFSPNSFFLSGVFKSFCPLGILNFHHDVFRWDLLYSACRSVERTFYLKTDVTTISPGKKEYLAAGVFTFGIEKTDGRRFRIQTLYSIPLFPAPPLTWWLSSLIILSLEPLMASFLLTATGLPPRFQLQLSQCSLPC